MRSPARYGYSNARRESALLSGFGIVVGLLILVVSFLVYTFTFTYPPTRTRADSPLSVATFNIRYDSPVRPLPPGEAYWSDRVDPLVDKILYAAPDIIGLQEALPNQNYDIMSRIGDTYHYVTVGRDDGGMGGEAVMILFRKSRFNLISKEHFWLSDTPSEPSVGWDGSLPRVASIVRLREHDLSIRGNHDNDIVFINTHMDDAGSEARGKSAQLILEKARKYLHRYSHSLVFLVGDLNAGPEETPLKTLKGPFSTKLPPTIKVSPQSKDTTHFLDTRDLQLKPTGLARDGRLNNAFGRANVTWTDFDPPIYDDLEPTLIDYILIGHNAAKYSVSAFGVYTNEDFNSGMRVSDHQMVYSRIHREVIG